MSQTKKRGRPSRYTAALAERICKRLASGETLRSICKDEGMPREATVRGWALDDLHGFFTRYDRARQIGYLAMADHVIEIADDSTRDRTQDADGTVRPDTAAVLRSRLRVDTRKWLLAKALPKVFGHQVVLHEPLGGPPPLTEPTDLRQSARAILFALATAMREQRENGPVPLRLVEAKRE